MYCVRPDLAGHDAVVAAALRWTQICVSVGSAPGGTRTPGRLLKPDAMIAVPAGSHGDPGNLSRIGYGAGPG
jgi:hypothetical protein